MLFDTPFEPKLLSLLYLISIKQNTPSFLPIYLSTTTTKLKHFAFTFTFTKSYHQQTLQEIYFIHQKEETNFVLGIGYLPRSRIVEMETVVAQEAGLNLKATELRLGLPGTDESEKETVSSFKNNKRSSPDTNEGCESKGSSEAKHGDRETAPAAKAQVVGWPPIRNYRKNSFQQKKAEPETGIYVKVSMDGAPYLRKIDLKLYKGYSELLKALENMFKLTIGEYSEREGYKGSEFAPTYEDKDGDWMLVGDVPWEMFMTSCKRLRIMKASEARGLGCGV